MCDYVDTGIGVGFVILHRTISSEMLLPSFLDVIIEIGSVCRCVPI